MKLLVNNRMIDTEAHPGTVALDLVRSHLNLKATKEGCREGDCGACTVLIGEVGPERLHYRPVNSCILPAGSLEGCHLVTLEGLNGPELSPLQREIVEQGATQCGFCTPGIELAVTGFLIEAPQIGDREIEAALAGNICRCTGYSSITRALHNLARQFSNLPAPGKGRIDSLVEAGMLPEYFGEAFVRLTGDADHREVATPSPDSISVGGGTDLFVQRPDELLGRNLSFVRIPLSAKTVRKGDSLRIDARSTLVDLQSQSAVRELLPNIDEIATLIASPQIRARATVGGNIVNASPIGDMSIIFLALDATVCIEGPGNSRQLPLKDLFRGYKNLDLKPGELVEALLVPAPRGEMKFNFEKVSRRTHMDIASVNTAMTVCTRDGAITGGTISAGGVAPIPLVLEQASNSMIGKLATPETAREAAKIGSEEASPIGDVRGSADYKRLLLRQLILAHFSRTLGIEVAE